MDAYRYWALAKRGMGCEASEAAEGRGRAEAEIGGGRVECTAQRSGSSRNVQLLLL